MITRRVMAVGYPVMPMNRHMPASRSRTNSCVALPVGPLKIDEFDVVQLQDVDVIGAEQAKALLEAAPNSIRGEVELFRSIPTGLGADNDRCRAVRAAPCPGALQLILCHRKGCYRRS